MRTALASFVIALFPVFAQAQPNCWIDRSTHPTQVVCATPADMLALRLRLRQQQAQDRADRQALHDLQRQYREQVRAPNPRYRKPYSEYGMGETYSQPYLQQRSDEWDAIDQSVNRILRGD